MQDPLPSRFLSTSAEWKSIEAKCCVWGNCVIGSEGGVERQKGTKSEALPRENFKNIFAVPGKMQKRYRWRIFADNSSNVFDRWEIGNRISTAASLWQINETSPKTIFVIHNFLLTTSSLLLIKFKSMLMALVYGSCVWSESLTCLLTRMKWKDVNDESR